MPDKTHLTYNEWRGDIHKGVTLDHRGLTAQQVQEAIDKVAEELKQMQQDKQQEDKAQVIAPPPGVCWRPNRLLYHKCDGCPYWEGCTCKRKGGKKK